MNTIDNEEAFLDEATDLVLNVTKSTSTWAGIGWATLDNQGTILSHDAMMIGAANDKLTLKISQQPSHFDHLLLSSEPISGALDINDLIAALNNSNCTRISIAKRLPDTYLNREWREWKKVWSGSVQYLPETRTAEMLIQGVTTIKEKQRPWVTAVYASNLTGKNIPINAVSDDFTVKENLRRYAFYSRGVLYNNDQKQFIKGLPEENIAHEFLEPFEIYDDTSIRTILEYWAKELRCNVVIYSNQRTLSYLAKYDLVDEIVYCLAEPGSIERGEENIHISDPAIDLSGWKTTSCSTSGNGCQLVLRKKTDEPTNNRLQHRLN